MEIFAGRNVVAPRDRHAAGSAYRPVHLVAKNHSAVEGEILSLKETVDATRNNLTVMEKTNEWLRIKLASYESRHRAHLKAEEDKKKAVRPQALPTPTDGQADDLTKIKGIGRKIEKRFNKLGCTRSAPNGQIGLIA